MTTREQTDRAVLLKATDYRDADRIITVLTEERGRLSLIARNARRSQKRFGGALVACTLMSIQYSRGRGDLHRLRAASPTRYFPKLLGQLDRVMLTGRVLELVRLLAPQDEPQPRLFAETLAFFEEMGDTEELESVALRFQIRALTLAGMSPNLQACVSCGARPQEGRAAMFGPVKGGIVCRACGGGRHLLSGSTREALLAAKQGARAPFSEKGREQASVALAAFASAQLGTELSPMRTRT